jgi:cardiolipin synthase A/B
MRTNQRLAAALALLALSFGLLVAPLGCAPTEGSAPPDRDPIEDTAVLDSGALDAPTDAPLDGPAETFADAPADSTPTPTSTSLVVLPDDGAGKVLDAIRNATTSVHLEMYMLTDRSAIDALVAAKKAGREVKVLVEKSPYGAPTANDSAVSTLKGNGVDVKTTTGLYALTHSKLLVVDHTTAHVMTLNFTFAGLSGNREYDAVTTDEGDVAQAEAIFAADFAGTAPPGAGDLVVSPLDARARIGALLSGATKTIDIEVEEFTDSDMATRISAAVGRGVAVRIVAPNDASDTTKATLRGLGAGGTKVKLLGTPGVHAKVFVVDGARAYVGSNNLTTASLDKNREVGLVTETAATLGRLRATIDADFAKGTTP